MKPYASSALLLLVTACGVKVDVLSTLDGGNMGNATGATAATTGGQATGGSNSTGGVIATGGTSAGGTTKIDDNTVITLQRTQCDGSCPAYSLSISGNGTVTYQGNQFVKVAGAASSQIPVADVQSLVDSMLQADYFNLSVPANCPEGITDMPSANTSLTLNGETHKVDHYQGNPCAPAVLKTIEDLIDTVTNSAQWVHCDTSPSPCDLGWTGSGGASGTGGTSGTGGAGGAGTTAAPTGGNAGTGGTSSAGGTQGGSAPTGGSASVPDTSGTGGNVNVYDCVHLYPLTQTCIQCDPLPPGSTDGCPPPVNCTGSAGMVYVDYGDSSSPIRYPKGCAATYTKMNPWYPGQYDMSSCNGPEWWCGG